MTYAATASTNDTRAWAIGSGFRAQVLTWSAASGDTSGTITATGLIEAQHIIMDGGLQFSAAPTFSTNVVTLAFVNPAATCYGTVLVLGR